MPDPILLPAESDPTPAVIQGEADTAETFGAIQPEPEPEALLEAAPEGDPEPELTPLEHVKQRLAHVRALHPPANQSGTEAQAKHKERDTILTELDAMVIGLEEKAAATSDLATQIQLRQQADALRREINHTKYTK